MVVSIRLTRLGCRNHPFYRVIVTDSKAGRDGKHIEVLGFYNPKIGKDDEKRMSIKLERVKYWLSVGAQPSDTVQSLLYRAGFETPDDGLTPNQEPPTNGNNNEVDGISPEAVFSIGLPVN